MHFVHNANRFGFAVKKMPYVLCVTLKRTGYNWETGLQERVNDSVSFPLRYLNVYPLLPEELPEPRGGGDKELQRDSP